MAAKYVPRLGRAHLQVSAWAARLAELQEAVQCCSLVHAGSSMWYQQQRLYCLPPLQIWNATLPLYYAHLNNECTHFCSPG